MDQTTPNSTSHEEPVDFSQAIRMNSMLAVYHDIEKARCECGGSLFPNGPVGLKSPENTPGNLKYELMFVWCSKCAIEHKRLYVLDTNSNEYRDEQRRAYADLPKWAKGDSGNPIEI